MKTIIVILILIIFILSFFIYKQFRDLKRINKQLEIKIKTNSNFIITTDLNIAAYINLCDYLNAMYDKYNKAQIDGIKKEIEFKEMLSNIAHDVRTPLTSVQGYLEIMKEKDEVKENEEYHRIIEQRIHDIRNLLEQFFIYSKLLNNDYKIDTTECNLYNVCCESLAGFYREFSNQKLEPIISFKQQGIMLDINKDLLKRVFDNLIGNALLHGNGNIMISQDENKIMFSNTFISSMKPDKDRIFDRFYKADNSRVNISSGLGLSIVKEIVGLFNWDIKTEIQEDEFMIKIIMNNYK